MIEQLVDVFDPYPSLPWWPVHIIDGPATLCERRPLRSDTCRSWPLSMVAAHPKVCDACRIKLVA